MSYVERLRTCDTSKLTETEVQVLKQIATYADDGIYSPPIATIASWLDVDPKTVRRAIWKMSDKASVPWLTVERHPGRASVLRLTLDGHVQTLDKPWTNPGQSVDTHPGQTLDKVGTNPGQTLDSRACVSSFGSSKEEPSSSSVLDRSDEGPELPSGEVPRLTLVASTPTDGEWAPGPVMWQAMIDQHPHLDVPYQRLAYLSRCGEEKKQPGTAGFSQWLAFRERQAVDSAQREKDLAAGRAMPSWGCDNNMKPIAWGAQ